MKLLTYFVQINRNGTTQYVDESIRTGELKAPKILAWTDGAVNVQLLAKDKKEAESKAKSIFNKLKK